MKGLGMSREWWVRFDIWRTERESGLEMEARSVNGVTIFYR